MYEQRSLFSDGLVPEELNGEIFGNSENKIKLFWIVEFGQVVLEIIKKVSAPIKMHKTVRHKPTLLNGPHTSNKCQVAFHSKNSPFITIFIGDEITTP